MLNLSFVVDFLQITLCVKGQLGLNCPRSQSETSTFALSYDEQYIYIVLSLCIYRYSLISEKKGLCTCICRMHVLCKFKSILKQRSHPAWLIKNGGEDRWSRAKGVVHHKKLVQGFSTATGIFMRMQSRITRALNSNNLLPSTTF